MGSAGLVGSVGLIGLGLVGNALATRLIHAGYQCYGFDKDLQARERFSQIGGTPTLSISAIALSCSTVIMAVFNTADVIDTVEGNSQSLGLVAHWPHQHRTVIDCSTGDPEQLTALANRLQLAGIAFIEAPLSGSSAQIVDGQATMLIGGAKEAIETHEELLDTLSPKQVHVGLTGMGAKGKLATNLVLGLNRAVLAEGMVFAQSLGIAPEQFLKLVLATPAKSDAALLKGHMMVSGEFTAQSKIRQHLKDVRLMLDQAQAAQQRLPLSEVHAALMQAAIAAGDGELDNAAIINQIRREKL